MSFVVPASKGDLPQNRFGVEMPDGTKFTVPKMQYLSADLMERVGKVSLDLKAHLDNGGKATPAHIKEFQTLYRDVLEQHAEGLYQKLDTEQLMAVIMAWTEASTIGLGESQASAD